LLDISLLLSVKTGAEMLDHVETTCAPTLSAQSDSALRAGAAKDVAHVSDLATSSPSNVPAERTGLLRRRPSLEKAALSVFNQAVYSGTSFLTAVIVGRSLSQSDLGIYYLTLTIVLIMFGVQENAVSGPYTILAARRHGRELAEYTGSMWAHHFALTFLGMLAIVAMIGVATARGSVDFTAGLWTLLIAGPPMLLRDGMRRLAFARLQLTTAIALDVTVSVLQLAGLALLWQLGLVSVAGVFGVMGAACAVACLGWLIFSPDPSRFVRSRFLGDWHHNWVFARWAVLSWLAVDTVPFVMPWIVDLAAGTAATGLYGACGTLVGVTNILVIGTGNFLRPKSAQSFASGGVPALRKVLVITGCLFAVVFGLFTVSMAVLGDWLAVLVYGESFRGAWTILTALAANVLVGSLGFVAANGLWAIGKPRASMFADALLMVATIVAAVLLVGSYGALGAALAALIGSIVGMFAKGFTLDRLLRSIAAEATPAELA
jgi:O-antigen/teichoic acid export membrane protein